MNDCHIVTGPAAAGKSVHARNLAAELGACLIDSDTAATCRESPPVWPHHFIEGTAR